jgi:hypothetical protein
VFLPDTIRLRVEPVHEGNPELGRELDGDRHVPQVGAPVTRMPGGMLQRVKLLRVDRSHPPVARLLLQRLETVLLGDVQQVRCGSRALGFRPHQLAGLRQ